MKQRCWRRSFVGWLLAGATSAGCCLPAAATEVAQRQGDVWALIEENDRFAFKNLDRHYTQGLKLLWLSAENRLIDEVDSWLTRLPALGLTTESHRLGFTFGQNIYSPDRLELDPPDPTDRPYAGWLYGGMILQRAGTSFDGVPTLENLEIDLGIIGPASLGEIAQTQVHRWTRHNIPKGWDHQLDTEPGLLIRYGRFWRLAPGGALTDVIDVIPYAGGAVGNVAVYGGAGALARLGWHLPADFGPQRIDGLGSLTGGVGAGAPAVSFYVFGGVEGRAIAHDLFLDGNSFTGGPSVEHEPLVGDLRYGATLRLGRHCEVTWINSVVSRQFTQQTHGENQYGSLLGKLQFDW